MCQLLERLSRANPLGLCSDLGLQSEHVAPSHIHC